MANDHYGGEGTYEEGGGPDTRMTKLQILMGRSFAGWPLYTIVISLGQLLSAVSGHDVALDWADGMTDILPTEFAVGIQHRDPSRPVHHLLNFRRRHSVLVHPFQDETFGLGVDAPLAHVS